MSSGDQVKSKKKKVKVFTKKIKKCAPEKVVIEQLQEKYASIDPSSITSFSELPLSNKSQRGLKEAGYKCPTDIQRETIALSLQGKDILGAAQTGSGKTLAFLVPLLEVLYSKQWTRLDGVGALVITPTRELAFQIFETLKKVGSYHDFSAGLIIGGKDLKFERKRMDQCNIVICTPGRVLQHMDENPLFDCLSMQVLVLDEADRCLDMGFAQTMNAIIANLPPKRQTLLFSATQTKSVKDLARLSLKDPCYVAVHENSKFSTPTGLEQSYVVCNLQDKVSIIWSFIRNHNKKKCIIFFSSCKEVKYIYEIFCKLRPGMSIMALYGSLHQLRRMSVYEEFCRKTSAVLFATDLAARGLDFPTVHWVVQADCPEDVDTYIHRVGRTARFHRGGESLLLLLHSEEGIVDEMMKRRIPINKIDINPSKLQNPVRKMEAFLARDPQLKDTAQRAFVSYVKSVFLMKNKSIFDVHALDTDSFANSLGLAIPPRIRFLQRQKAKSEKQMKKTNASNKKYFNTNSDDEGTAEASQNDDHDIGNIPDTQHEPNDHESSDSGVDEGFKQITRYAVKQEPNNIKPKEETRPFCVSDKSDSEDDSILTVKRKDHDIELPTSTEIDLLANKGMKKKALSKAAMVKKILRKKIAPNKKTVFNDEGEALVEGTKHKRSELAVEYENENRGGIDIEKAKLVLKEEDKFDKQLFKQKVKWMHREQKKKLKEQRKKRHDEQDEFGSDSEEEQPDLSWLPDPDKIYGPKNSDDDDEMNDTFGKDESSEEVELESQPTPIKTKKRKIKHVEDKETVSLKKKKPAPLKVGEPMSVNEAEELAMMFLKSKR